MQTIYIKNSQVFYSHVDGAEVVYLPDDQPRSFVVELDPRKNSFFEMELSELKKVQKFNISQHRDIERNNGVLWNGVLCDASKESQNDLNSLMLQAQINPVGFPKQFKFKDGVYQTITIEQFQEMVTTISIFVANLYEKESQLYALIDQATTASEIIGIKW